MSDLLSSQIVGLDNLQGALARLPKAMSDRVMRGAFATGASVFRKEAIARAPVYTDGAVRWATGSGKLAAGHPPPGTLKRAIYQRRLSRECTRTKEVWFIGVRKGKRVGKNGKAGPDAFYAGWVERGHYSRPSGGGRIGRGAKRAATIASGGVHWIPAHPFMRPAFETKKQAAIQAVRDYIRNTLPIAVEAAGARGILKVAP